MNEIVYMMLVLQTLISSLYTAPFDQAIAIIFMRTMATKTELLNKISKLKKNTK